MDGGSGNKCQFINCGKSGRSHHVRKYRFPANEERARKWIENSGNPRLQRLPLGSLCKKYVCGDHFQDSDFYNATRKRLLKTAVPLPYVRRPSKTEYKRTPFRYTLSPPPTYEAPSDFETVDPNKATDAISVADSDSCSYMEEDDDLLIVEDCSSRSNSRLNADKTSEPNSFQRSEDEFDMIGNNVASKLRTMNKDQRIIAERIIAETLFQGQMCRLTSISTCSSFYPVIHELKSDDIKLDPDSLPQ